MTEFWGSLSSLVKLNKKFRARAGQFRFRRAVPWQAEEQRFRQSNQRQPAQPWAHGRMVPARRPRHKHKRIRARLVTEKSSLTWFAGPQIAANCLLALRARLRVSCSRNLLANVKTKFDMGGPGR
jgi:hypothetical protein